VVLLAGARRQVWVWAVRGMPGAHLLCPAPWVTAVSADSPDVAAAKRLLDAAKDQGFRFQRIATGPDGPLLGVRKTPEFLDEVYVAGFWEPGACTAIRRRRSPLVVPGGLTVTARIEGDVLTVLHTVVTDWACS